MVLVRLRFVLFLLAGRLQLLLFRLRPPLRFFVAPAIPGRLLITELNGCGPVPAVPQLLVTPIFLIPPERGRPGPITLNSLRRQVTTR